MGPAGILILAGRDLSFIWIQSQVADHFILLETERLYGQDTEKPVKFKAGNDSSPLLYPKSLPQDFFGKLSSGT